MEFVVKIKECIFKQVRLIMSKFLTDEQTKEIAKRNNLEFGVIKAIHKVESKGSGFLEDGKVKILFERHIFFKLLNKLNFKTLARQMSALRPDLCHKNSTPKGGYGKEWQQHQRLQDAIDLVVKVRPDADDNLKNIIKECALKACSWGLGQVMGFNHKLVGYDNIHDFVQAMETSEALQLEAMIEYLKKTGLTDAMQRKDWRAIAKGYNGINYAKFDYHNRLAHAYAHA